MALVCAAVVPVFGPMPWISLLTCLCCCSYSYWALPKSTDRHYLKKEYRSHWSVQVRMPIFIKLHLGCLGSLLPAELVRASSRRHALRPPGFSELCVSLHGGVWGQHPRVPSSRTPALHEAQQPTWRRQHVWQGISNHGLRGRCYQFHNEACPQTVAHYKLRVQYNVYSEAVKADSWITVGKKLWMQILSMSSPSM